MRTNCKTVAIIQARMGSRRLPGKSMQQISGKPLLQHVIERTRHSPKIDDLVVATTIKPEDEIIVDLCRKLGVQVFQGSELDVLTRYYHASLASGAEIIARVTADDPFKDPEVIDQAIDIIRMDKSLAYVSNTIKPTYPLGLDIEVLTFAALKKAWGEAVDGFDREHVTPYIWRQPQKFALKNFEYQEDLSHMRWTLDTLADLNFTQEIYNRLYNDKNIFLMQDILTVLAQEPNLMDINTPHKNL